MRPLILISNDDGYEAKGINCLIDMVKDYGDVLVCAPDGPRSGQACAFSATTPLTLTLQRKDEGVEVWSCNGTPVDCVKMALANLCPRKPDAVIYSLCDYRADADFSPMDSYVRDITQRVLRDGLPQGVCLNVNFPVMEEGREYNGVKVCRMSRGSWLNETSCCRHPRGYDYWWMVGQYRNDELEAEDTDRWALDHGYVAITPTQVDVTAHQYLNEFKQAFEQ